MQITLIHNPTAGGTTPETANDLVQMIREAGHKVVSCQSTKESQWKGALEEPGDLIAVAGGDGTVRKVAGRLRGRGVPIGVLPLGTANNLAGTLGLVGMAIPELIATWAGQRYRSFDCGLAQENDRQKHFLESVGTGLFAWTTCTFQDEDEDPSGKGDPAVLADQLRGSRRFLGERLKEFRPAAVNIRIDDWEISGDFVLVEAMNTRSMGPNLRLAPEADPGDGILDVVLVPADQRELLQVCLQEEFQEVCAPGLPRHRGKRVRMEAKGIGFHLDGRPWSSRYSAAPSLCLEAWVESGALMFAIP